MSAITKLGQTATYDFATHDPTDGALSDADSLPTCKVFEDTTDVAILEPTVVKRTGYTGCYRVPVAATAGNGFEVGKTYNIHANATVNGIAAESVLDTFILDSGNVADVIAAVAALPSGSVIGLPDLGQSLADGATIEVFRGDAGSMTFDLSDTDHTLLATDTIRLTVKADDADTLDAAGDTGAVIGPDTLVYLTATTCRWDYAAADTEALTVDEEYRIDIERRPLAGGVTTVWSGKFVSRRDVTRAAPSP